VTGDVRVEELDFLRLLVSCGHVELSAHRPDDVAQDAQTELDGQFAAPLTVDVGGRALRRPGQFSALDLRQLAERADDGSRALVLAQQV